MCEFGAASMHALNAIVDFSRKLSDMLTWASGGIIVEKPDKYEACIQNPLGTRNRMPERTYIWLSISHWEHHELKYYNVLPVVLLKMNNLYCRIVRTSAIYNTTSAILLTKFQGLFNNIATKIVRWYPFFFNTLQNHKFSLSVFFSCHFPICQSYYK